MEDYILQFIIMLVLSYIFEEKIIPQMGIVGLVLVFTSQIVFSSNQASAYPVILYSINIIYAVAYIIPSKKEGSNEF